MPAEKIFDVFRRRYNEIGETFLYLKLTNRLKQVLQRTLGIELGSKDDGDGRKDFLNLLLQQCDKVDPAGSLNRALNMLMAG